MIHIAGYSIKTLSRILIILLLAVSVSLPAVSAEEEWERLTAESFELFRQRQYDDAIRVSREALTTTEKALGPHHPVVAKSMNNLGAMLSKHGDVAEAERLFTGALDILEESLGKDNPGTASTLNNLAELYSDQGRYEEAEPLYMRARSIREKKPGEDHMDLITTLDNIAVLYVRMDRFRDAEKLYSRVMELRAKYQGKDHPDTKATTNNLIQLFIREGNLYKSQDRLDEAAAAYDKALGMMKDFLPLPEPAEFASLVETLAVLSVRTNNLEEAISFYEDLNSYNAGLHGIRSIEYARSTRDLARVYIRMERYEQAFPLYESVVEIQSESLDNDDPELIRSMTEQASAMTSLAKSYLDSGRTADAVPLFAGEIEIRKKTGKADDPSQAVRMNNLAGLLVELERYEEALQYYSIALELLKRSPDRGQSHKTLILKNMRQLYSLTGALDKAAEIDSLLGGTTADR